MYTNSQLLHEIVTGQWLMDFSDLVQLRHFFDNVVAKGEDRKKEEKPEHLMMSFFNEELERINPREISEIPKGSIAFIKAIGPMMKYGGYWFLGADEVVAQLDFANNQQNIAATVLYVDGPGGSVSAINPFIEFASRKRKPIVSLADQSLSLHKWIPSAVADYQMADNNITARFGSIGVLSSWMDFSKYYEDLKIILEEVYSDHSQHKNEIWRAYKDDPEKGRQMLRDMQLNPMAKKFQEAIKAAHPNLIEEEGVLTGRVFGAEDAVRLGMINKIGTLKEAMQIAQGLAEMSNY
jgi:protease-4